MKTQQKNWIGRSTGAEVDFKTTAGDTLTVFTTRPDTLFGATYMVIAPEHAYVKKWKDRITNYADVEAYVAEASRKSDFERTELVKDKTGVRLEGVRAINPVNGKRSPSYLRLCPGLLRHRRHHGRSAHDTRDWEFAKKFGCEIVEVVKGRRRGEGGFHPQGRHRHHGQFRLPQWPDRQGGHPHHHQVAGEERYRP